jgi:hypothetical protein
MRKVGRGVSVRLCTEQGKTQGRAWEKVGKHTWSDRRAKTIDWVVGSFAGLPSLIDGLLDGHVYPAGGWAQINQKLVLAQVLAQALLHQWAPNKLRVVESQVQTSSSECLFSEGQTQERHRFCNGFVKRRRAPRFTGMGRRYVVQTFVREPDLTAESSPRSNLNRQ